jgi:hypothetical protein
MSRGIKSLKFHFIVALIVRIAFTLYGCYHDQLAQNQLALLGDKVKPIPKYTDIDYQVFTDAARYIYQVSNVILV